MRSRTGQPLAFDHRGKACELIDPTSLELPWELRDALPAPGMRSKGAHAEGHWTLVVGWGAWFVAAGAVFYLTPAPWNYIAVWFLPAGAMIAVIFRPISRSWRRAAAKAIIETMLRFGRCPGCGYPLERLGAGDDGCVQCPECGAAWRVEVIASGGGCTVGAQAG